MYAGILNFLEGNIEGIENRRKKDKILNIIPEIGGAAKMMDKDTLHCNMKKLMFIGIEEGMLGVSRQKINKITELERELVNRIALMSEDMTTPFILDGVLTNVERCRGMSGENAGRIKGHVGGIKEQGENNNAWELIKEINELSRTCGEIGVIDKQRNVIGGIPELPREITQNVIILCKRFLNSNNDISKLC